MHVLPLGVLSGLLLLLTTAVQAISTFTPTRPPSLPLAVKSPYLSTWFPAGSNGGNGGYLPGQWPSFWTGQWLGWTGLIKVDGTTFLWMGAPSGFNNKANQTSFEYTSTKSIFTMTAGKVELKVTFLSPLTPKDYMRQSLIFSYMDVEVTSLDGSAHDVQLYTDISAEWTSGNINDVAQWSYGVTGDLVYHKVWKQNQQPFNEVSDRAEWGNWYYTTKVVDGFSYRSGADVDVRSEFDKTGSLANTQDTQFRPINQNWPVFGYALNMSSVGSTPKSQLFTIGLCQDDAIQFLGAKGLTTLPSLWKSYFGNDVAALSFFYNDYQKSGSLSTSLDTQISADSKAAAGDNYVILTSLAARQAFGATQLVGTRDKYYLFLKEISSNGNTQTVDVIYPASPIFYYTNPDLVKLLLDPHFENQESGHYPNSYAEHDLGTHYPNATGHPDGNDEAMPLEECGNQMVMVLAYVQRSGNTAYIQQHYTILKQWATYLVQDSLYPALQLSTDDFAGHLANQTNLALKGIIGLAAMAEMSRLVNQTADAQTYLSTAKDYMTRWQGLGINNSTMPPHATLTYNDASTHGLLYNLYNDALLSLNLVPHSVYNIQSNFYPTLQQNYGVPLDTRNPYYTKSDWEVFCAAVASPSTRDMLIGDLARWVGETSSSEPFSDLYETNSGVQTPGIDFKARPVMGGMFALLVLGKGYSPPN
ncbi:putative glutaminase [Pyrenophora seminiperda CCB06]|uniref:Putative glutaminase n=1 Tax=Pyrenophora seminiperda CCB06 TaxID=1302712 RepID=A0A3M7MA14_9PLEO|nr:putative glutaminase [Pyrenophora seminiperda CCB06]